MNSYRGSCHCGALEIQVATDLADPVRCNCSFCARRGAILQKVPADKFELVRGDESNSVYGNREFSDHYFCKVCGVHVFTRSTRNDEDAVVVNVACLDDVDPSSLAPRLFDGATLL